VALEPVVETVESVSAALRFATSVATQRGDANVAAETSARGAAQWYAFGGKTMDASYFVNAANATASGHGQFVFDTTDANHHTLYWDSDGMGAATKIMIADLLTATLALTDFDLR